ncbi:MAG TPA: branched-chain amino acid ABC transporter permease [Candidatus Baltobacteraceae bacterium]|nr:branched-chain amino acid ABC transporter permease [Candidatus Baltobacteraceae bacterium]
MSPRNVLFILVALAGLVLPRLIYPVVAMDILCFALFALALDLLFGFAGLLSFGQAMFWGGSAYTTAILVQRFHVDSALAIAAAVLYATLLAGIVGLIVVRRSGIYFAMITLGIAQIEYFAAINLSSFTGGENGLPMDTRGTLFGAHVSNDVAFYFIVFAVVAICFWLVVRLTNSPFGTVLGAIRQNETRAIALGYRVNRYKLAAFTIAGALSGLAGGLYALSNRLAGLEMIDWHTSGAVVMMTVLGGSGTIVGPAIGAGVYEIINYFVSATAIGQETDLVMGLVFVVCILAFRQGIAGGVLSLWRKTST